MHQAAHILKNEAGEPASSVRRRFDGWLGAMARHRDRAGELGGAVDHFRKVARSYCPGLFHCYAVSELPPTGPRRTGPAGAAGSGAARWR